MNTISVSDGIQRSIASAFNASTGTQGIRLISAMTALNNGLIESRIPLPAQVEIDLQVQGPFTGMRGANTEQISRGLIHPDLVEELKKIEYFELMKAPPSIHQLFSHDFRVLVDNLVEIQNQLGIFARIKEGAGRNTDIVSGAETWSLREVHNSGAGISQHDFSSQSTDPSQQVAYNHLLYASGNDSNPRQLMLNNQTRLRKQKSEQDKKPYFEKKPGSSKKNSQKLLKQLIKTLQGISRTLSNYIE